MSPEEAYKLIVAIATEYRQNGGQNGQAFWGLIKKFLEGKVESSGLWTLSNNKEMLADFLESNPEIVNGEIQELNHFVAQMIRIPLKDNFSAVKVLQIAFNFGQLVGKGGKVSQHLEKFSLLETHVDRVNREGLVYKFTEGELRQFLKNEGENLCRS